MTPASAGLDPLSLVVNTEYGGAMHYARRYDEAIQILRKTLDMDRSFSFASWYFAQALERIGRCDEAIAELERVGAAGGIYILMELASAHAVAGRPKEARRILAEQLTKREARRRSCFSKSSQSSTRFDPIQDSPASCAG